MSRTNTWHKTCKYNIDYMQVFVIINNGGMKINAGENVKN